MSKVEELRRGIIQRLNNPEGLQEEEVDSLIVAVKEETVPSANYDVGFIAYGSSTIDPKTGVTTYHDVKLIEVSQMLKATT